MKNIILLTVVMFAVACSSTPDREPPELSCESVSSFDIKVSGCNSDGCWATTICNRQPVSTDYMGPAVVCSPIVESAQTDDYMCRW